MSNDELQQKLDDLNNNFLEDIESSERMIKRIKDATEKELSRINEQIRLTGENIEKNKRRFGRKRTRQKEKKYLETSLRVASRGTRTKRFKN